MPRQPIRVLELRSVRGTGGGPEKTIMLGAAQADPTEFAVTVCYIRDRRDDVFTLDKRATALGLDYVEVEEGHSFDPSIWRALRRLVRERGIQIVHAHDYKTDLLALLLAAREGIVPLATVHGWSGHSWRERYCYYPADRKLLARYPRLIAVSGELKRQLVAARAPADRVTVILNAIDPDRFKWSPDLALASRARFGWANHHRVIGAVGRLGPEKRFDLLIEAVRRVHQTNPDVRLMIAGDGQLRPDLTALASRLLPSGVCSILGHTDDMASVYHAMDVFVLSSDHEGTPNAVLEAMAFTRPVVATDAGGTAELARPNEHALIVPTGDAGQLADAIVTVLSDPIGAQRRARLARARVEGELSFSTRMHAVENIYRELVTGPGPGRGFGVLRWNRRETRA